MKRAALVLSLIRLRCLILWSSVLGDRGCRVILVVRRTCMCALNVTGHGGYCCREGIHRQCPASFPCQGGGLSKFRSRYRDWLDSKHMYLQIEPSMDHHWTTRYERKLVAAMHASPCCPHARSCA